MSRSFKISKFTQTNKLTNWSRYNQLRSNKSKHRISQIREKTTQYKLFISLMFMQMILYLCLFYH